MRCYRFSRLNLSFSMVAKTNASSVTFQKSAQWPQTVLSQVYSNWRVRQALLSSEPLPGKSSSARAETDRGSKVVKPSNAIALIGGSELPTVGTIPPNKQVATLPVAKFTNCRD